MALPSALQDLASHTVPLQLESQGHDGTVQLAVAVVVALSLLLKGLNRDLHLCWPPEPQSYPELCPITGSCLVKTALAAPWYLYSFPTIIGLNLCYPYCWPQNL